MQNKLLEYIAIGMVVIFFQSCQKEKPATEVLSILPSPTSLIMKNGQFVFNIIEIEASVGRKDAAAEWPFLWTYLETEFFVKRNLESTNRANLIFVQNESLEKAAYELIIREKGIEIQASTELGALYALYSLRQMLPDELIGEMSLPCVEIKDAPRFPWRGMLLDCSRHFMDKDFVKKYIDLLSFHKMNVLHWHITEDQGWRLEIKKYPLLTEIGAWRVEADGTRYGGFYTQQDIKEIVQYGEQRGVTIVPEIEMPGHCQAALAAYPQFSCTGGPFKVETEWGVFKEIYCAGNDSTFVFLKNILDEVMELFPGEYIHIGGDEVPKFRWEHCAKCKKRMQNEGLKDSEAMQSWFLSEINEYLKSKGRKMIGWDEIFEGGLPQGASVQAWRGFEHAAEAAKGGHDAIVSPTSHAYFDYDINTIDLQKVHSFNPIPEGLTAEEQSHILGGECNLWSEHAPQNTVDSKVFPRILAMSEVLWTSAPIPYDSFYQKVQHHYRHLQRMEVDYGFETEPVGLRADLGLITLIPGAPDLKLSYSLDGSEPQTPYEQAFQLDEDALISVRAEKNGHKYGELYQQKFSKNMLRFAEQLDTIPFSPSYTGGGNRALQNGLRGSENFRDGNWQAVQGEDIEVRYLFSKPMPATNLIVSALQYNNAWILFPPKVIAYASEDGESWQLLGELQNQKDPKERGKFLQEYPIEFPMQRIKYLKVQVQNFGTLPAWHDAGGSDAWLFLDEVLLF